MAIYFAQKMPAPQIVVNAPPKQFVDAQLKNMIPHQNKILLNEDPLPKYSP